MTTPAKPASRAKQCSHLDAIRNVRPRTNAGCEDCLRQGSSWNKLRVCLSCGHVGCCDSSTGKHATAHFNESGHPLAAEAGTRFSGVLCGRATTGRGASWTG